MNTELSLILPAYNASKILEAELPGIIRFLQSQGIEYEIIVVDDGSKDWLKTREISVNSGCIFTRCEINSGKGAALKKGFALARGKFRLFSDCDLPFLYANLLQVFETLKTGNVDLVIGDRTHPDSKYYLEISSLRKWGSNLIAGIAGRLLQGHIRDTQCGLKGFSSRAASDIFRNTITCRFAIDFELLFLATKHNFRIERIPVALRVAYPSTLNVLKDGPFTVWEIFKAIMYHGRNKKKR